MNKESFKRHLGTKNGWAELAKAENGAIAWFSLVSHGLVGFADVPNTPNLEPNPGFRAAPP